MAASSPKADRARIVVALDLRAAVEDLRVARGDLLVQCDESGIEIALRARLELEMVEAIGAAHQGRAVRSGDLADRGRHVAYGEADAAVIRGVGRRAVDEADMVERHLAGLEGDRHRLALVDIHRNLLAAGQEVVLIEG